MSASTWESELAPCYEVFDARHDELRDLLHAKLADKTNHRTAAPRLRPRILRSSLALAAGLLLLAGLWSVIPLASPAPAFGLDELPQRLQQIDRIYIHGWTYYPPHRDEKAERAPTERELYVEQPRRYFQVHSDYVNEDVRRVRTASDGQQRVTVDDLAKTATRGKEIPLAAEYKVQCLLQENICQQLLGGPTAAGFQKLRSEKLNGVTADVFERIFQYPERPNRMRFVVWFNPATGLPLRVEQFHKFADKPEVLLSVSDKIEVDGAPPAGAFDFTIADGYTVKDVDASRDKVGSEMSGGVGTPETGQQAFHALRFCFNLGDHAALVCWARYNDLARRRETDLEGPLGRKLDLAPTSSLGDRQFANYYLRVDSGPDFHWRWSLVVPQGRDTTIGDGQLVFTIVEDDGFLAWGTLMGKPLQLDRDQLARWVVEAQRLTLPEGAPAEAVFTLEQLEALARQFHEQQ